MWTKMSAVDSIEHLFANPDGNVQRTEPIPETQATGHVDEEIQEAQFSDSFYNDRRLIRWENVDPEVVVSLSAIPVGRIVGRMVTFTEKSRGQHFYVTVRLSTQLTTMSLRFSGCMNFRNCVIDQQISLHFR